MTTATDDVTKKVATVIDHIATAVANSSSSEEAREALARMVADQSKKAAAAAAEAKKTQVDDLVSDDKVIKLPNGIGYHVRKLGNHDDVSAFRELRKAGVPFMLYGPPGTGKTAGVEAAFSPDGSTECLHTVLGTGDTEVGDLIGSYVALPGGSFEWIDGPLIKAMEAGEVLFVDEIGLIDTKVLSILYSVMDGRGVLTVTANPERGTVTAKEGFYVCAATNPNAPGVRLSEALLSRFSQQVLVKTDYALARTLGVPAKIVTCAENMQRKVDSGEMGYAPQLRELLAFKKISTILGEDVALRNVISGAPDIDRPQVQEVLQKAFGKAILELEIQ